MNPQRVVCEVPFTQALLAQMQEWSARRVVLATTRSLQAPGGLASQVEQALGSACQAVVGGLRAHAPRQDIMRLVRALADCEADAVVGLGGGSVTSVVKIARLALANGVQSEDGLDRLLSHDALAAPAPRCVMLPTTLSAGEYTDLAGMTDLRVHRKQAVQHDGLAPETVILDPALLRDTPRALLLGTAIRALDHIVETWCSTGATALSDAASLHALNLMLRGLQDDDLLTCQQGARLSIQGIASGVPQGASHGIGHALGGVAGVGHGDTSCIMLPHVLRFNAPVNAARQQELAQRWPGSKGRALDDIVQSLVADLGLPQTLRFTGMDAELMPQVARESMASPWVKANPRRITDEAEILTMLRQAW
ncbi:MAG: iron-containing alcohol dehydrogenase [Burkholderiaceae bacterium]|nr:iron-containing alcohol dehydrogenase [Burkholderiaceae bacterium]